MKKPAWKRYLDLWGRNIRREVDDEFQFHLEMRARELEEEGLERDEARRLARECFGSLEEVRRECVTMQERWDRQARFQESINHLWRDFKFAFRQFGTRKTVTMTVVFTLAAGIGVNAAVFSLVHSILLRPLPYPEPQQLVRIWDRNLESGLDFFSVSVPHLEAWKEASCLSSVGAYREDSFNLRTNEGVEAIRGARVSAGLLEVLSVQPEVGRNLTPSDDLPGSEASLMIGYGLWQRLYGGSPQAVGQRVTLDGASYRIVGVLGESFVFPQQSGLEILVPYQLQASAENAGAHFLRVLGRLHEPTRLEAAIPELNRLAASSDEVYGLGKEGWSVIAQPLQTAVVSGARSSLALLMGAVIGLLLIACCNVANLYLVGGVSRRREFALRTALGASRSALVRQLLMEVLVVSLLGAGLGIWLGLLGQRILVSLLPQGLPRLAQVSFGWPVFLFSTLLALVCGLLIGLLQSRSVSRSISPFLNSRSGNAPPRRLTHGLVSIEVALSLALLVGGAILTQSFLHLARVDPGFVWQGVQRASISTLASKPEEAAKRIHSLSQLWEGLNEIGGVQAAALVHRLPLDGNSATTLYPRQTSSREGTPNWVNYRAVSPNYFEVLGIPFLEGRDFEPRESWGQADGVIVNRTLAELFWPGESALGKQLGPQPDGPWLQVVGVVASVHEDDLASPPQPAAYLPYGRAPVPSMEILVKGSRSAADLNLEARALLQRIDPPQGISTFEPMGVFMAGLQAQPRAGSFLVSTFAILATFLALLGVVGLVSAAVAGRMHELGVRLVLGATPGQIVKMAFRDGLRAAAVGVILGLGLAWLGSGWLASYSFEVTATDPATYIGTALVLLLGAGLAAYLPSRRAAHIDPRRVLDSDTA